MSRARVNACNPSTGCTVTFASDGTVCGSTNVCTGRQTCGSGLCVTAAPLTCADSNPCTTDACNPASGCEFPPVSAGTSCADGNLCNGTETCNATGTCAPGTALTCNDGNPCTTDSCSASTGCVTAPAAAGTSCSDGDMCNGAETCSRGTHMCVAGRAVNCDDGDSCTTDGCTPATGMCTHTTICDAGTMGHDAGPGPFDPATDYPGHFIVVPSPSMGCGCGAYTISSIDISVSGGTLSVTTGVGTLTQTPAPTGEVKVKSESVRSITLGK